MTKSLSLNNILPLRRGVATIPRHESNSFLDGVGRDVGQG